MKLINTIFFLVILIFSSVHAKTIDKKKEELKKIYEAGGISDLIKNLTLFLKEIRLLKNQ